MKNVLDLDTAAQHSMSQNLHIYVNSKISNVPKSTSIIPQFNRDSQYISSSEKKDKLFNWKRPTLDSTEPGRYFCFPGKDYILHYQLLLDFYLTGQQNYNLSLSKVSNMLIPAYNLDIPNISNSSVILGYVEPVKKSIDRDWSDWCDYGEFSYSVSNISDVLLLGCKHSYWGDISGRLVEELIFQGVKNIIYVGKLGSMVEYHIPNKTIVTGSSSNIFDKHIDWSATDLCKDLPGEKVHHITLPSPMMETVEWVKGVRADHQVVDPEIGHMSLVAKNAGINFGYLHIVTDNLTNKKYNNIGLHNERRHVNQRQLALMELCNKLELIPIW